jgi:hypothetical protein
VDWCPTSKGGVERRADAPKPLIIYPRSNKYASSYQFPFLQQMSRFQMALRQQNTCLVIVGFGFRDDHLTGPIQSAIESNVGLRVFVVSPSLEDDAKGHNVIRKTSNLIKGGDRRLTFLAGTFEEFVRVLPDLTAESDDNELRKRVGQA